MVDENGEQYDGYVSAISVPVWENGKQVTKKLKLRCDVVEVYPMTCPKCGGSLELKYGHGKCPFCNTNYSTSFRIEEEK